MSIEPTVKETDNPEIAGEERRVDREERHADRSSSTAEVAKDLERPEVPLHPTTELHCFRKRRRTTSAHAGRIFKPASWTSHGVQSSRRMRSSQK